MSIKIIRICLTLGLTAAAYLADEGNDVTTSTMRSRILSTGSGNQDVLYLCFVVGMKLSAASGL